jgi:endonuclease YncB( thermonuclease family)
MSEETPAVPDADELAQEVEDIEDRVAALESLLARKATMVRPGASPTDPQWFYHAIVERIVDGDTVDLAVLLEPHGTVLIQNAAYYDLGFRLFVPTVTAAKMPVMRDRFRLRHIDTPEIRGPERVQGLESAAKVAELLPLGHPCLIESFKNKKGKYGRWIINIWQINEKTGDRGICINEYLLEHGLAKPWKEK